MTFIRPQATALLWRLREVILTSGIAAFGLWLVWLGGWFLVPLGLIVLAIAGLLLRHAFARLRFLQAVGAPGIVELDEAQLAYMGPEVGGYISLNEAVELRLVTMRGRRLWRIKQADGQAMLVPVDAAGAEQLFDAFAALPGMDVTVLSHALDKPEETAGQAQVALTTPDMRVIWRRPSKAGLTSQ